MHQSYTTAAPRQLHTTLPGPNGTHACLTLYDVCPHTAQSTSTNLRLRDPYFYCDLPTLPSTPRSQTVEYLNRQGKNIVETMQTDLSLIPPSRSPRALDYVDRQAEDLANMARSKLSTIHHPKEKAMAAYLAPLVMSRHSPMMHHVRESTAPPVRSTIKNPVPEASPMPTMYLLTFSTDRAPTTSDFAALLNRHLPLRVPLMYTIDARSFLVPPRIICETYSGVSDIVQHKVLRDSGARREIDYAVDGLTKFVRHGGRETGLAVCCTAGTHRSVAIAELIAQGVRDEVRRLGTGDGVKIVVRHVHRVRGPKDPY